MGGDALFGYDGVFYTLFLLTPPRGGDKPGNTSSNALGFIFLLTPPRGGRQGYDHQRRANRAISTHAPAWGATATAFCRPLGRFISTHAPARRATLQAAALLHVSVISTHAPAWGATFPHDAIINPLVISTHAPRGGRRFAVVQLSCRSIDFYSRPRMGATKHIRLRFIAILISTHAPTWGATIRRMVSWRPSGRFLLTPQNRGRTHRRGTPQAETGVRQP